jgi:hypothetical protein
MSCREEVGVSFVTIGILDPQTARHCFRSAANSRHLTNSVAANIAKSSYYSPIMYFAKFKEQQHVQKQEKFHGDDLAEAPPGFQAGCSDCMYFSE